MAAALPCTFSFLLLLLAFTTPALSQHAGFTPQETAPGLSYDYYKTSCPKAYDIVNERVKYYVTQDPGQAAGILRVLFHDCFVQGCDGSILLEKPVTELIATPNNASLRLTSLKILDEIKKSLEVACPGAVSCADTIALAASEAVHLVGGPLVPMPTGRRDSRIAASNQTVTAPVTGIPAPTFNVSALKTNFLSRGLNVADLVALSGGHTIGQAHCKFIDPQISPQISTDLSTPFGINLSKICLPANSTKKQALTAHLDFISPNIFDNAYFKNVLAKRAIFHSDATLMNDTEASSLVELYAENQEKFFAQFSVSMLKMSQLGVLTGNEGEVRRDCTVPN